MNSFIYEMQGFTWQARKNKQQDAILIKNHIIFEKGRYSTLAQYPSNQSWCVAVADGISSQPNSDRAAVAVLEIIKEYYSLHETNIPLSHIQDELSSKLIKQSVQDAGTTMALIRHSKLDNDEQIRIQSLGDSRVYYFSYEKKSWRSLTQDDNFYNEMDIENLSQESLDLLDSKQELASMYDALTGFFCANSLHEVNEKQTIIKNIKSNDVVMVCTDGAYDAIPSEEWPTIEVNQSLKDWLTNFYESVKPYAGDNISLVVVRAQDI